MGRLQTDPNGRQWLNYYRISWLVMEIYKPGFIKWMRSYKHEKVVHHKDGNPSNDLYGNLQIMCRSDHSRMHTNEYFTDPSNSKALDERYRKISESLTTYHANPANAMAVVLAGRKISKSLTAYCENSANAEAITWRGRKHSEWFADPANSEALDARSKKLSKSTIAYFADLGNSEAIAIRGRNNSKTKRKKGGWKVPDGSFSTSEYAQMNGIGYDTAGSRLRKLLEEGQIICRKMKIDGRMKNVYKEFNNMAERGEE